GNLGGVGYSSNPNRKIAIIEIENEETYTVTKYHGGDRFNVMLTNEVPTVSNRVDLVKEIHQGAFDDKKQSHTFKNDVNARYLIVQTNFDSMDTALLQVERGSESTSYVPSMYIPSSYLEQTPVSAEDTTFFKESSKNMFGGNYLTNYTYLVPGNVNVGEFGGVGYSASVNRKIAIIEI